MGNRNIIFKVLEAWNTVMKLVSNEDEFDLSLLNDEIISVH